MNFLEDTRPLLALTLWSPWAFAFAHLGKDVENRLWKNGIPWWLIGRHVAIHAGSPTRWTRENWGHVIEVFSDIYPSDWIERLRSVGNPKATFTPAFKAQHCSRIVCVGRVADILPIEPGPPRMNGWKASNQEGIRFENVVTLPEGVPCKGTVTPIFWHVEGNTLVQVREQYKQAIELRKGRS